MRKREREKRERESEKDRKRGEGEKERASNPSFSPVSALLDWLNPLPACRSIPLTLYSQGVCMCVSTL